MTPPSSTPPTSHPPAKIVMAFNHAGGAAKTTTVRDLGYELAQRGFRVLLVDLDPQANLSAWLGYWDSGAGQTLQETLEHYSPLPEPLEAHGMHLIPSHLDLTRTDIALSAMTNPEGRLRRALDEVRDRYDFILLDPPPSLGKLTANAANAADWVIVPVPARFKGIQALGGVREMLRQYGYTNPALKVAMYLVTQMTSTAHAKDALALYEEALEGELAGPITERPAVYNRCQPEGRPVGAVAADAEAKAEIAAAVDFFLARVGAPLSGGRNGGGA